MSIKNNGNVGIGTDNPTRTLDVNGDLNMRGSIHMPLSKEIRFDHGRIIDQGVPARLAVENFVAGGVLYLRGAGHV